MFSGRWAKANEAAINGFFRAVRAGEQRLASSDEDWLRLMPPTGARNLTELKQVRDAFRSGIPKTWGLGGQSDATKLFHLLAEELGDPQLTGRSKEIAQGTFFFGRT